MGIWTLIGGFAVIIGIVAGIVQVLDYLEKRRIKRADKEQPSEVEKEKRKPVPLSHDLTPSRQLSWYATLDELEAAGRYEEAIQWITQEWSSLKSWELLVQLLHFTDLLGEAGRGLSEYVQLRETLPGNPLPEMEHAERYYVARLRGQRGWIIDALSLHRQNVPFTGPSDVFQIKSSFEIGQLLFRVEDFRPSRTEFEQLWKRLESMSDQDWLAPLASDVLKFLGIFEMLHVIHDFPFSLALSDAWQVGDPAKSFEFARRAYQYAEQAGYHDGITWAHAVRAFGLEGMGKFEHAIEAYQKSETVLRGGYGRRTSIIYVLAYHAGFYRRRGELGIAEELLKEALTSIPPTAGGAHHACILENFALLAEAQGERDTACEYLAEAMQLYSEDVALQTRIEWPKVRRLQRTCDAWGLEFSQFFP